MHIAWGPFLLALVVIVLVPGPNFVLVTRNAATGRKWGWLTAAGVTCGLLCYAVAAVLGLSALVAAAPVLLTVLKVVGVCYLAYLGIRTLLRTRNRGPEEPDLAPRSARAVFLRGLLCDVLNPKVMLVFLTLVPQAMDPHADPTGQAVLLSSVVVLGFAGWWLIVVPLVGWFSRMLAEPKARKVFERCCGGALIAMAGLLLAD
ncbi:LysE family translocator [Sciscionella marina]|uniref:LysE family translocator n=1 Tax=Sciscionella marina TaxID=508770 RepID=UPI000375C7CD|nr:LysE family translocator [Sciscionella marina]